MADRTKKNTHAPQAKNDAKHTPLYHFMSTVQEQVDLDTLQARILDTQILVSLHELLGALPDMQRHFANLTKTQREYTDKSVKAYFVEHVEDDYWNDVEDYDYNAECEGTLFVYTDEALPLQPQTSVLDSCMAVDFDPSVTTEEHLLHCYSSTVKIHVEDSPLYAMVTGRFLGTFGGVRCSFMVDTGSELNLVSDHIYKESRLPIDLDGTRWSLKGINGHPVRPGGCVRDVPVVVSGK